MKLLCNCWVLTGANLVESKTVYIEADRKFALVRQCHLTEATAHYGFVFRKAMQHQGPEAATVAWIIDREKSTRSKAKDMPWNFALSGSGLVALVSVRVNSLSELGSL